MASLRLPSQFSAPFALRETCLIVGLLCVSAMATAQTQTASPAMAPALKEVVISGSRTEQDPDELPMSIDVFNLKDLENGQIQDIRDVAADLPNVTVPRAPARFAIGAQTGRDQNSGFNIRGLGGNRVLMLVDGIRQPLSYTFPSESAVGRDYIDIGLLKRVEIVRGATSALYGSDGVAGLVNFITKDPADYLANGKTFGGSANVGYSSDRDGWKTGVTMAGRGNDTLSWLFSGNLSGGDAIDNMGTNDAANSNRTTPNPEKDKDQSLLGKLVFTPGGGQKHVFTFEHVDHKADYNLLSNITAPSTPPLTGTALANSTIASNGNTEMQRDRLTWDGSWQLDSAAADRLRAVVSYQDAQSREYFFQDRYSSADRSRITDYSEKSWQLNLQANKQVRMGTDAVQKITYGFDYVNSKIRNLQTGTTPAAGETYPLKRFPDTTESSAALYGQDEIVMGAWSITPGVRVDHFKIDASQQGFSNPVTSMSDTAVSPKLGALFRANEVWSVYGNYASGFKAPNAGQVNAYFANPQANYRSIPNPNLKPEKSQNFEIGTRGRLANLSLDVAAFTGRYKDFIEDFQQVGGNFTAANPGIYQSINIGKARISGFEIKGRADWGKVGDGQLSTPFAYGQTKGENSDTGVGLNSVSPESLLVGLEYATPVWSTKLNVHYYGGKDKSDVDLAAQANPFLPPSATIVDLSGQWRISKDLRLTAGVYNLTDKKYWQWSTVVGQSATSSTIDAYTQPGRNYRVALIADF
ncbi:TonB-dependent hemoglobin/transferrin/lactoferrin family receptor [Variovorax sp. HJSM1_2]|uniref:TonB-dependent hemoglobin/transferrin/lactoferrin family receptor n=1 Tax=Variovorax sp. HJSM1_2 TaxID=3366263 RepID=UPI003BDEC840